MNKLYYGDNLEILRNREYLLDGSGEDYFAGRRPDLPDTNGTLKKAKRITKTSEQQEGLGI